MPKQKRWQLKRQLDQAVNDLERAQRNIIIVAYQFEGQHDDYYDALAKVVYSIDLTREVVDSIKEAI